MQKKLKKTGYFWMHALGACAILLIGFIIYTTSTLPQRSSAENLKIPILWARLIGGGIMAFGGYGLLSLFFRAEKLELAKKHFRTLENFQVVISGFRCSFQIKHDGIIVGKSAVPVFWYALKVDFTEPIQEPIHITRRNRTKIALWHLGLARKDDVLTGIPYFDSRFFLRMNHPDRLQNILSNEIIEAIATLDRNYTPVRKKFGRVSITPSGMTYLEGPYHEQQRIFGPHRGDVERTLTELVMIAEQIEKHHHSRQPAG